MALSRGDRGRSSSELTPSRTLPCLVSYLRISLQPFNRYFVSVPPLGPCASDVAPSVSRRGGEEGRCCRRPLTILPRAQQRFSPSLLRVSSSLNRKVIRAGKTWLDIWKSSAPFRGPPPLSPETPRCLRRLQISRVCLRETVSADRLPVSSSASLCSLLTSALWWRGFNVAQSAFLIRRAERRATKQASS